MTFMCRHFVSLRTLFFSVISGQATALYYITMLTGIDLRSYCFFGTGSWSMDHGLPQSPRNAEIAHETQKLPQNAEIAQNHKFLNFHHSNRNFNAPGRKFSRFWNLHYSFQSFANRNK